MPTSRPRVSLPGLLSRWLVGMGLVSWRYLWQVTPLHRTEDEEPTTIGHELPALHADISRADIQRPEDGHGPLYHRLFRVRIDQPRLDGVGLTTQIRRDFGRFVPKEVVRVHRDGRRAAEVGNDFVVDMPGPWNGPVRVVAADATSLRLATLEGHLEAGEIEFRGRMQNGQLVFEIESWARPGSWAVDVLYTKLRLAKEIQLNMWVRFCESAAKVAGGRVVDGVEISTVRAPAPS